jgi:mono/diheme cytochrome c family protein
MPANNPGYLSDSEVADIVAYMLATSGLPAGDAPLPPDVTALAGFVIVSQAP